MKTANQVELEPKIIEFNGLKKRVPLRKRMRCHFFKRLEVQMVTRRISEHEGKLFPCLRVGFPTLPRLRVGFPMFPRLRVGFPINFKFDNPEEWFRG